MSKLVDKVVFNLLSEVCGDDFTPPGIHPEAKASHVRSECLRISFTDLPMSLLWTIMYLTVPVQSMIKVALAGAPQSLATPMLIMERERSVKMEKPAGPPNPPRDTSLLIHLLTARGLSLVTPTISHWFLVNSSICYLKLRTSEESTSKSRGKKKSTK